VLVAGCASQFIQAEGQGKERGCRKCGAVLETPRGSALNSKRLRLWLRAAQPAPGNSTNGQVPLDRGRHRLLARVSPGVGSGSRSWFVYKRNRQSRSLATQCPDCANGSCKLGTGHAIHGSYDVKRLGRAASHGCVRLSPANAAALFALVKARGVSNTEVVLTGGALVARRKPRKSLETDQALSPTVNNLGSTPAAWAAPENAPTSPYP
jgi:ribosomal protein S27E